MFKAAATWIRTLTSWESWRKRFRSPLHISFLVRPSSHQDYGSWRKKCQWYCIDIMMIQLSWLTRAMMTLVLERNVCQFSHGELLNLLQTMLSHRTSALAKALAFNLFLRHQGMADHILIIVKSALQRINPLLRLKCTWLIKWFYFSLYWLK